MGYTIENALLVKCIEGDDSDDIPGIGGVKLKSLLGYFPDMVNEKYTYKRLVEEGYDIQEKRENGKPKKKRLAKIDKIIQSEHVLYRNAKLMNLRKPFLNQESIESVDEIRNQPLDSDRSIETAMSMFASDGMVQHIWNGNLSGFFGVFYSLKAKEKEFEESLK
jgi:5'-3' exonuclease